MKINYRPEIDGLRAISILSVIIYHSNFFIFGKHLLPGGFLGVDIFFVISGYLIATFVFKRLKKKNFSFKDFYERRARRILPAYLFVLCVSLPFSYFILLPNSLIDYSKSIISSILFISNLYFHYSGNFYGADDSLLKPFLHTWSLSVEEQFYLIFPIFIFICYKFFKKYIFLVLLSSMLLSIFFAQIISNQHTSFNFFIILSRIFELFLGVLLSYLELNKLINNKVAAKDNKYHFLLNQIFPSLGVIFIFFSLFFFNEQMNLPSLYSLIPCLGACFILLYSNKNEFICKLLSSKILVFIGVISYSLYLWHYPLFAYLRYLNLFEKSILIKILYISLLFLLSLLSYVLVERPFRKKNNFHFKKVIFIFGSLIFILLSFSSYFLFSNGLNQRFSKAISVVYEDKIALNPSSKIDIVYNRDGKSGNVVLIGDSIAQSLVINLNEELKKKDYNLFYFDTYFYINGFDRINSINKFRIKGFIDNNKKIENFLEKNHNLIIILSNEWSSKINKLDYHNNKEQVENKLLRNKSHTDSYFIPILENIHNYNSYEYFVSNFILTINNLTRNNNKLILIYPVPSFNYDVTRFLNSSLLFKKVKGGEDKIQILSENYQFYKDNNKEIFDIFDGIKNPNIFRVYPDKLFCNSKILNHCVANSETEVFFRDNSHLTFLGSKYLVSNILGVINKIK